jgi:tRNA (guanine37-N1)-methyltransferase
MIKVDIITLFPDMFSGPFDESMIKRAQDRKLVNITIHNLRTWGINERGTVDDRPYAGGVGMLLMVEPVYKAINELKTKDSVVILMTPQGEPFKQKIAKKLSQEKHLIILCGHYEGFDERIREHLVDLEISIGDFVLTGGEIPAMAITDAIVRLVPGVLNKSEATEFESFEQVTIDQSPVTLLEYPHYTRPEEFQGWKVPEVLLSGNHVEIEKWRKQKALERTKKRRPDLIPSD